MRKVNTNDNFSKPKLKLVKMKKLLLKGFFCQSEGNSNRD